MKLQSEPATTTEPMRKIKPPERISRPRGPGENEVRGRALPYR
jgi:hypothetical protein